jgi:N-acetyl-gamma-glutamyl-phosphate reductase / acetylglutamate kinase
MPTALLPLNKPMLFNKMKKLCEMQLSMSVKHFRTLRPLIPIHSVVAVHLTGARPYSNLTMDAKNKNFLSEKETIIKLLYNIGSRNEVEQYLTHFSSVESHQFAVIKVGGAVLTDHLETLASALTFLNRVGLYPIVVHGAGPQLNTLLQEAGITPQYEDGIRITCPKTLEIARKVFQAENLKLVDALESLGTRCRPINTGVFSAVHLDKEKYNLVGKITSVNKELIESSIDAGSFRLKQALCLF